MSNKEILEKAIRKAIDGGWDTHGARYKVESGLGVWVSYSSDKEYKSRVNYFHAVEKLIFNQNFAKALWGETLVANRDINEDEYITLTTSASHTTRDIIPAYKFHLQEMVIADDPIKYLAEHLEG